MPLRASSNLIEIVALLPSSISAPDRSDTKTIFLATFVLLSSLESRPKLSALRPPAYPTPTIGSISRLRVPRARAAKLVADRSDQGRGVARRGLDPQRHLRTVF